MITVRNNSTRKKKVFCAIGITVLVALMQQFFLFPKLTGYPAHIQDENEFSNYYASAVDVVSTQKSIHDKDKEDYDNTAPKYVSPGSDNGGESTTIDATTTSTLSKASTPIRKWGCNRRETPTIFVHIGKAGGGEIRMRLALSAENYTRSKWRDPDANHLYPIRENNNNNTTQNVGVLQNVLLNSVKKYHNGHRKGRFCNSKNSARVWIPKNNQTHPFSNISGFEGSTNCNATTPFGIAIACPTYHKVYLDFYQSSLCQECDDDYYLDEDFSTLRARVIWLPRRPNSQIHLPPVTRATRSTCPTTISETKWHGFLRDTSRNIGGTIAHSFKRRMITTMVMTTKMGFTRKSSTIRQHC